MTVSFCDAAEVTFGKARANPRRGAGCPSDWSWTSQSCAQTSGEEGAGDWPPRANEVLNCVCVIEAPHKPGDGVRSSSGLARTWRLGRGGRCPGRAWGLPTSPHILCPPAPLHLAVHLHPL